MIDARGSECVRIGNATLYRADCMSLVGDLTGIDALITDPPYGIGYKHSGKGSKVAGRRSLRRHADAVAGDTQTFDPTAFLDYPTVVMFGANHFAHMLPPSAGWLVWDKRDGMASNSFSDCEMAWTQGMGSAARLFRYLWNGVCQAGEKGERRYHQTQKPIALMEWVVDLATDPGNTVLDPYMGSGTTGLACVKLGRRFIGIEIDERHFETACRRIEAVSKQPDLFVAAPALKEKVVQESLL